jgi:hypothetical protein
MVLFQILPYSFCSQLLVNQRERYSMGAKNRTLSLVLPETVKDRKKSITTQAVQCTFQGHYKV